MEIYQESYQYTCAVDFFPQDLVNAYNSNRAPVPETVLLYYGYEMLSNLSTLHQCGIIHADVKPDNFMLKDLRYNVVCKYTSISLSYE